TTVYLFYYDRAGRDEAPRQSLLELFEQYFTLLPSYKPLRPGARHLRPLFGYIPARHGRAGRTAARGLLCLGDSAAGQSPLTFCGFGSFVPHLPGTLAALVAGFRPDPLAERDFARIGPDQAYLRPAWAFALLVDSRPRRPPA